MFIGSLNLDPRSIEINSEMGMLIDNEEMAGLIASRVLEKMSNTTYRVELDEHGKLIWRATIDGVEVVETKEPLTSRMRRFSAFLLRIVPDSQL